jgi:lipopolysaccharide transport system permease protein
MFAWRDIVLRYKQTVIGVLWVVMRPLITVAIFAVVFGKVLKVPSGNIPYPLLILSGFIPWQLFTSVFAGVSESLFSYSSVLSKVYFPRIAVPLSAMLVHSLDALIALLLMVPFMAFYEVAPSWRLLWLPFAFLATLPAAFGLGLWFSAIAARYRDFRNVVPFVVVISLYASPVAFPAELVPEYWRDLYWINPLVGIIEAWRWILLDKPSSPPLIGTTAAVVISLALLAYGYRYFRRSERAVVDVI